MSEGQTMVHRGAPPLVRFINPLFSFTDPDSHNFSLRIPASLKTGSGSGSDSRKKDKLFIKQRQKDTLTKRHRDK